MTSSDKFTEEDRILILAEIKAAEKNTSGEIRLL